jgi:hypothetical protein
MPEVLEITENLWRSLQGRELRGEVWTVWTQVSRYSKEEVTGEHVDTVNVEALRPCFDPRPTIYRVYRTDTIEFGVDQYLPPVPMLMPMKSAPPKGHSLGGARPDSSDQEAYKRWIDDQKRLKANRDRAAKASANGTH